MVIKNIKGLFEESPSVELLMNSSNKWVFDLTLM